MKKLTIANTTNEELLFHELVQLIEQSKQQVFSAVNSSLTLLFWNVGNRINQEILKNKRAEYGKTIVPTLSAQFGKYVWKKFYREKCKANVEIF